MKFIKLWLLPLLISIAIFVAIRPVIARQGQVTTPLADYLTKSNVNVGVEVKDGFSRAYYEYSDNKVFVSQENQNAKEVDTDGRYIVWVLEDRDTPGQIFRYDILSNSIIQLSFSSTNSNPKVSKEGNAVWQTWVNPQDTGSKSREGWQIILFDGKSVIQISTGDASFNADIEGDFVSYTRRDVADTYRAVVYSISRKKSKDINTGFSAKNTKVKGGKILLANGHEEFPLTAEDFFTIDLAPLSATGSVQTVTIDDILRELEPLANEATPSEENRSELSSTPSPTPVVEVPTQE